MATPHPFEILRNVSLETGLRIETRQFAEHLDAIDELKNIRKEFHYPKNKNLPKVDIALVCGDSDSVYLCGNSLGLCCKGSKNLVDEEFQKWQEMGVYGHHSGKRPWEHIQEFVVDQMAKIVGAKPIEVVAMNALTVNLHTLMVSFYRPTPTRYKILMEAKAFPSDHWVAESQISYHGYDPKDGLVLVHPRPGEETLRTEDILMKIETEGHEIATVLFSGVQYYTGQKFDMKNITEAAQRKGCKVGFDLAHAVGNVELQLHDWNVDFAAWCTYKYLNAGPGSISGIFVHERYAYDKSMPRFTGWWGTEFKDRFNMDNSNFKQIPGARGFQCSNPCMLSTVSLLGSLQVFDRVGMPKLLAKQRLLTGYLEYLIKCNFSPQMNINGVNNFTLQQMGQPQMMTSQPQMTSISILTPDDVNQRGCQLSLVFSCPVDEIFQELTKRGVVCDLRRPSVIRVAPAPLYNSYMDIYRFVETIRITLLTLKQT